MGGIAEQKWQIEHVEIVDHRADSADALHRGDGRVAGRMNVGRFECRLRKSRDWRASGERERAGQGCGAAKNITSAHYFLPNSLKLAAHTVDGLTGLA